MADKNGNRPIPVELLLSSIGKQVKVDVEAHRRRLLDDIERKRQRLTELRHRRAEVVDRDLPGSETVAPAAPDEDDGLTGRGLFDTASQLEDDLTDDWLAAPALSDNAPADDLGFAGDDWMAELPDDETAGEEPADEADDYPGWPAPSAAKAEPPAEPLPAPEPDDDSPAWAWPESPEPPRIKAEEPEPVETGDLNDILNGDDWTAGKEPAEEPEPAPPAPKASAPAQTEDLNDILNDVTAFDPDLTSDWKF